MALTNERYFISQSNVSLDEKYDEAIEFASSGNLETGFTAGLVFEELFVNVMNYAYTEKGGGPIMASIEKTTDGIYMTLIDFGVPFNPVERANWIATSEQIGGRGIDLVKSYSKVFEYQRIYDANVVNVLV